MNYQLSEQARTNVKEIIRYTIEHLASSKPTNTLMVCSTALIF